MDKSLFKSTKKNLVKVIIILFMVLFFYFFKKSFEKIFIKLSQRVILVQKNNRSRFLIEMRFDTKRQNLLFSR